MRVFVSLFLFLLFLLQTFNSFVLDGMYCLNRSYIAKTLCVNKAKPALHCSGKCYLAKQVEKENKSDAAIPGGKKEKENASFFPSSYCVLPAPVSSGKILPPSQLPVGLLPKHSALLLRPPCLPAA